MLFVSSALDSHDHSRRQKINVSGILYKTSGRGDMSQEPLHKKRESLCISSLQEQTHSLLSYKDSFQLRKTFGIGEARLKLLFVKPVDL